MQKTYNKLDIVVNIAVYTHFNTISILADFRNHIEIRANCYIDTISS